jgi:hypothetical protein
VRRVGRMRAQKSVNPVRYQAVFLERLESRRSALRECLTPEEQLTPDLDQRRLPRAGGNRENLLTRVGVETARKLRAESIHRGVPVGQILDDLVAKGLP